MHFPLDAHPVVLPPQSALWQTDLIELNKRIATLAHLLQVPLDSESTQAHLLDRSHPICRSHPDDPGHPLSSQARGHQEVEELRGLLVLRCELMTQVVRELGLEATHTLTQAVHTHMTRLGLTEADHGFLIGDRIDAMFTRDPA